jgi:succinate dehydrogenase/fumarate reductase flavoprotein subunit
MGGLCAAARAVELGARPVVLEKGTRPGGSMLISSCVVWRYRTLDVFRAECPTGDPALQARIVAELDGAIEWLERLGAPVVARETGNPLTVGTRFDPRGLTEALVRAAGEIRLGEALGEPAGPLVLATGGFQGDRELIRQHVTTEADHLLVRANPWSVGDGLRQGLARGAALSAGLDEFYGRNMPAPPARYGEQGFVELAQLYGRHAVVVDDRGRAFAPDPPSWSETDLVQATARTPGARAWYIVDGHGLEQRVRERTVAEMIAAAEAAGGTVRRGERIDELGLPGLSSSAKLARPPFVAVHVAPAITHTIGGLSIDANARVLRGDGAPISGLYACGVDAGGISTGGYASGLAAALVFGRIAAETALEINP